MTRSEFAMMSGAKAPSEPRDLSGSGRGNPMYPLAADAIWCTTMDDS